MATESASKEQRRWVVSVEVDAPNIIAAEAHVRDALTHTARFANTFIRGVRELKR